MDQKEIETVLLNEIYRQYPSVRAFAKACGIPHGTIVSALNNGIDGMAYGKVKKICDTLQLDLNSFEPICEYDFDDHQKQRLLAYFQRLSDSKKDKVFEYMKDIG